ncbi:hypothetical protein BH10PLA2_BH10PLA2_18100 [soil metagenome]
MRTLLILSSLAMIGCAHDAGIQVVGSVYCETERPEGRAVAKVEVRYTPPASEHEVARQAATKLEVEKLQKATDSTSKRDQGRPETKTMTGIDADQVDFMRSHVGPMANELAQSMAEKLARECKAK